jgi:hypothetical protein
MGSALRTYSSEYSPTMHRHRAHFVFLLPKSPIPSTVRRSLVARSAETSAPPYCLCSPIGEPFPMTVTLSIVIVCGE